VNLSCAKHKCCTPRVLTPFRCGGLRTSMTRIAILTGVFIPLINVTILTFNYNFLYSNIPSSPAYAVYMSQLIWYSRTCNSYQYVTHRSVLLTSKLLSQGFVETRLIRSYQHRVLVVTILWHSRIVSQWPQWLMTSVGHDIVV